jgi:hypothetical protein
MNRRSTNDIEGRGHHDAMRSHYCLRVIVDAIRRANVMPHPTKTTPVPTIHNQPKGVIVHSGMIDKEAFYDTVMRTPFTVYGSTMF